MEPVAERADASRLGSWANRKSRRMSRRFADRTASAMQLRPFSIEQKENKSKVTHPES
jgi:hypothetical protein